MKILHYTFIILLLSIFGKSCIQSDHQYAYQIINGKLFQYKYILQQGGSTRITVINQDKDTSIFRNGYCLFLDNDIEVTAFSDTNKILISGKGMTSRAEIRINIKSPIYEKTLFINNEVSYEIFKDKIILFYDGKISQVNKDGIYSEDISDDFLESKWYYNDWDSKEMFYDTYSAYNIHYGLFQGNAIPFYRIYLVNNIIYLQGEKGVYIYDISQAQIVKTIPINVEGTLFYNKHSCLLFYNKIITKLDEDSIKIDEYDEHGSVLKSTIDHGVSAYYYGPGYYYKNMNNGDKIIFVTNQESNFTNLSKGEEIIAHNHNYIVIRNIKPIRYLKVFDSNSGIITDIPLQKEETIHAEYCKGDKVFIITNNKNRYSLYLINGNVVKKIPFKYNSKKYELSITTVTEENYLIVSQKYKVKQVIPINSI